MNGTELMHAGLNGKQIGLAQKAQVNHGLSDARMQDDLRAVIANPAAWESDGIWGTLATEMNVAGRRAEAAARDQLQAGQSYAVFGERLIQPNAREQMDVAMRLPISRAGALMPDAHQGYGLPIGGVLKTQGAVIPWAVGVDIGCSVMATVLDEDGGMFGRHHGALKDALIHKTSFGLGCQGFGEYDELLDDTAAWLALPPALRSLRDTARAQLGSQGSGNHFVNVGLYTAAGQRPNGEGPGTHLAIVSHFGSRGVSAKIAAHYSALAKALHPHLPREARDLAWLDLTSWEGQEYLSAMTLAARFAEAGHRLTHARIMRATGLETFRAQVFNSHNLAWIEGDEVIHRKGATPAAAGQLGVIPGSMTTPIMVVEGLGEETSLQSASHGAGRQMGRTAAKALLKPEDVERHLAEHGVERLNPLALDEAPQAYKDIREVMDEQRSLVRPIGTITTRMSRMADEDTRED